MKVKSKNIVKAKQNKNVQMGLGEAMMRANTLQNKIQCGIYTPDERVEYQLIMEALNNVKVNVGFDCNNDGVPDTVDIFSETASTSCCRLVDLETGE